VGSGLPWVESEVAESFAGGVTGLVGLCRVRPDRAEALRRAAVAMLDEPGRQLVVALAAQITEEGQWPRTGTKT
jgi:hypothetical protein